MEEDKIYTTKEIAAMFNKKVPAVLKYARESGNIKKEGKDRKTRYFWTQKNIEEYTSYLERIKDHSNYNYKHIFKETDKLDTFYKRLNRALKKNDIELATKIRADIKEFRELKKESKK